jgi:two-component system, NarL family, response regulator YdfI
VISVLVSADSAVVRAGLAAMVGSSDRLALAGTAHGWADLAERVEEVHPEVMLVDAGSRGEDVAAQVAVHAAGPPMLLLTDEQGLPLVKAGARGVLPAGVGIAEIVAAIEAVTAGLVVVHPDALEPATVGTDRGGLTAREVEVLRMLAEGLANKEIAHRLGISEHTVKFHVSALFGKLQASSRTEAVTLGVRLGLILL